MLLEQFLNLPVDDIARLMRQAGPKVCVFPINGTRRWFLIEYPPTTWSESDFLTEYHVASVRRQLALCRLFFDHGVSYLLMPLFGPDLLERGPAYVEVMAAALRELAEGQAFVDFYREYDVRIHFYGDYRRYLKNTPYAGLCDLFDQINSQAGEARFHLFYGVFAHDAAETVAEFGARYVAETGRLPDKPTLVRMYYGCDLPPVSLFIGFDQFSAFDMPLVSTGSEDLYFTASPSFYMDETQLRRILYDHLFARRVAEQDYETLTESALGRMRSFYHRHRNHTFGLGEVIDGFWYPTPSLGCGGDFQVKE